MRSKSVDKHRQWVVAGFAVTFVIAIIAFYYAYTQTVGYGRTIEGTLAFAKLQLARKEVQAALKAEHPLNIQDPGDKNGCCIWFFDTRFETTSKLDVPKRISSGDTCIDHIGPRTAAKVQKKLKVITKIEGRECPKVKT